MTHSSSRAFDGTRIRMADFATEVPHGGKQKTNGGADTAIPPLGSLRIFGLVLAAACFASSSGLAYAAERSKSPRPASQRKVATPSDSEPPIDRAAAKAAFYEGLRSFNLGQWDEAVAGFEKSYKLSGDPALLFNVAQAQRQAGHRKEALIAYKAYLRENPDTPHRELVETKIRELEASAGPAETATTPKPSADVPAGVWVNPFEPDAPVAAPEPALAEPARTPSAAAKPTPPEKAVTKVAPLPPGPPPVSLPSSASRALPPSESPPFPAAQTGSSSNRWWWTGIGAVVAAGVVTAVILSTRDADRDGSCPPGLDGCLTVGK